jgi:hypothetical protein
MMTVTFEGFAVIAIRERQRLLTIAGVKGARVGKILGAFRAGNQLVATFTRCQKCEVPPVKNAKS